MFSFFLWWLAFTAITSNTISYLVPQSFGANFATAITAGTVTSPFTYQFSVEGKLPEASSMGLTWSPYWWVNSGGYMLLENGAGQTVQGSLPSTDPWRIMYRTSNPTDTDNGTHPQNIFRLVSRSTWTNVQLTASYKIHKDNFSSSPNRNASNGLLLMSRYGDSGDTLYYAGIRVDGTAVLKKKYKGTYYTMAQEKIFSGTYVEGGTVNLLPHDSWVSLRSDTVTNADGSVTVRLYLKKPGETTFKKILEAKDSGNYGGTPPIKNAGYAGLRTDFMDVSFDNFKFERI